MKKFKIILLLLLLLPINIYAYSDKVIVGGETIGIEVHSKGIYIVDFYDVRGKNIGSDAGFLVGDIIVKINNIPCNNINELNNILTSSDKYTFSVNRNGSIINIDLDVLEEDNTLKTGLYVKDLIYGIGTLSYIDPNTKVFGSLGHEILESNSFSRFEVNNGTIYKAEVSSINKSDNRKAGSKNANVDKNSIYGDVYSNEIEGIFGKYTSDIDNSKLLEVGDVSSIHLGEAYIKTVVDKEKVEDFTIEILNINDSNTTKNIYFKITDKKLISKTGGIVQGMSGSPIIQDNKIIGVVNYVIVDDTTKGYGIFITTMLKEGDKIIQ